MVKENVLEQKNLDFDRLSDPNIFESGRIRSFFPALSGALEGVAYLDSAATSQKPRSVIEAVTKFYTHTNANVHRGAYDLSQKATTAYEGVRAKVAKYLGLMDAKGNYPEKEIVFTSGTTDSINLVMQCLGRSEILNLRESDVIAVTRMEHHANFVPWQQLAKTKRARFSIIELDAEKRLDMDMVRQVLSQRPKLLAITAISNVLGVENPIAETFGTKVLVDAAQCMTHGPLSIPSQFGDVDFVAFSSHKMCGPSAVGILWGKEALFEKMPPHRFGGDMIARVGDVETIWNELPLKFEAGTPAMEAVVGFGAALDFMSNLDAKALKAWHKSLGDEFLDQVVTQKKVPGLEIFGPATNIARASTFSFSFPWAHPHDLSTFLDTRKVAVRAGHHCAQPLVSKFELNATTRASFSFYNTKAEVLQLVEALTEAHQFFTRSRKVSGPRGGVA